MEHSGLDRGFVLFVDGMLVVAAVAVVVDIAVVASLRVVVVVPTQPLQLGMLVVVDVVDPYQHRYAQLALCVDQQGHQLHDVQYCSPHQMSSRS